MRLMVTKQPAAGGRQRGIRVDVTGGLKVKVTVPNGMEINVMSNEFCDGYHRSVSCNVHWHKLYCIEFGINQKNDFISD